MIQTQVECVAEIECACHRRTPSLTYPYFDIYARFAYSSIVGSYDVPKRCGETAWKKHIININRAPKTKKFIEFEILIRLRLDIAHRARARVYLLQSHGSRHRGGFEFLKEINNSVRLPDSAKFGDPPACGS